jgi:hypothetical protein
MARDRNRERVSDEEGRRRSAWRRPGPRRLTCRRLLQITVTTERLRAQAEVRRQQGEESGARRIRTADLLGAIQALCQLSYSPEMSDLQGEPATDRVVPGAECSGDVRGYPIRAARHRILAHRLGRGRRRPEAATSRTGSAGRSLLHLPRQSARAGRGTSPGRSRLHRSAGFPGSPCPRRPRRRFACRGCGRPR